MNSSVGLATYAAILSLMAIGVWFRPSIALAAAACIFGLKQWGQSMNTWLANQGPLTNIAVGVIVLCGIVAATARGRCVYCRIPRVTYFIVLLMLYSYLSVQWTPRPDLAKPIWADAYPYLITFILLVPVVVQEPEDFRIALKWLLGAGGALVLLILVFGHWGTRGLYVGVENPDRETNPLALAGLGGTLAVTAMFIGAKKPSLLIWLIRLVLLGVSLLLVIRSGSRGQLGAILIATLAMLPVAFKFTSLRGFSAAIFGIAAVGGSVLFGMSAFVLGHDDDRWSQSTSAADTAGRFHMILAMLNAWAKHVVTMIIGLGNSAAFDPAIIGIYPHNVPVEILTEEGIIGFLLYAFIVFETAKALFAASRRAMASSSAADRGLVAAVGATVLFFFILSLKQGNMLGSMEFFMYSILMVRLANGLEQATPIRVGEYRVATQVAFPNLLH